MSAVAKRGSNVEVIAPSQSDAGSLMDIISRAANDPNTDVDKLERLMGMYERITAKSAEAAFNDAMAKAQAEMRPIAADASNPQTRSKYASYLALDKAMRPIYATHGFSLSFNTADGAPEGYVRVVCDVAKGGYSKPYHVDMPADGKGAKGGDVMTKTHAVGSAVTYGQRYLLKMIFNVAVGADDDGNSATATGAVINAAQKAVLDALIKETDTNVQRFCGYMKVAAIEEIPAKQFQRAIDALNTKRKQS